MMIPTEKRAWPQIKICGLTVPEEAAACAAMGADAIGLVFYPPSPRHLQLAQAAAITANLPATVRAVGVFVDPTREALSEAILQCRLQGVQLHGAESQALIDQVQKDFGVFVIKGLFAARAPLLKDAVNYSAAAFLLECGRGPLPGGNAMAWDWAAAASLCRHYPTVLAGGLRADNVADAVAAALPDAVDASSGLESAPGRKNLRQVEAFIARVRQTAPLYLHAAKSLRPVF